MGTSIKCIIPKEKEYAPEEIKQKLQAVFKRLKADYEFGRLRTAG